MYLSNRDLAAVTGLGKNCVRAGLDQLYSRRAIILRWGDNSTANRIYVSLWDGKVEELGGSKIDPPKPQQRGDVGHKSTHLPPENQGCLYASERPRLDSGIDSDNRSHGASKK